jgi:predicted amidohydrolase YtcJ
VPSANLVLHNACIVTLDPLQPTAQAIAVRDKRIAAVGDNASIMRYVGEATTVVDLHGAFVTPGFIEGHGHLMKTGESLMQINAGNAGNWDELVEMVEAAVSDAEPGQWIVGNGWQQTKWDRIPEPSVQGLPLHETLDAVSPKNPVLLIHASGHGAYANAIALRLAGITETTPDPVGGSIVRDESGNAIGMLRDTAAGPLFDAYKRYLGSLPVAEARARRKTALDLAIQNETSKGITTFVDMGEDFETVSWLKQQAADGIPLRLYINIAAGQVSSYINTVPVSELDKRLAEHWTVGYADDHFTVRGVAEIMTDGALGTHSAWFLEPYSDAPRITGINVTPLPTIRRIAEICARDGFQLSIHAIGDRANREALNVFQDVFSQDSAAHGLRWRVEHAQYLDPADIPRFAKLGVIASMQSIHACSDASMVVSRIGEKRARQGTCAWRSLIDSGAFVAEGTDTPIEDTDPIANFYCSVARECGRDGKAWFPAQAKTRMEELRSYTWNNAYAIFQEHQLGSLSPGKLADMTVFSSNLLTTPVDQILRTRVLYTIVGGEIVYTRPGAATWRDGDMFEPMPRFNHVA